MGTGNSRVVDEDHLSVWTCQYCSQPFPTYQGTELHEKHCPDKCKAQLPTERPPIYVSLSREEASRSKASTCSDGKVVFRIVGNNAGSSASSTAEKSEAGLGHRRQAWDIGEKFAHENSRVLNPKKSRRTTRLTGVMFRKSVVVKEYKEEVQSNKHEFCSEKSAGTISTYASSATRYSDHSLCSSKCSVSSKAHHEKKRRNAKENKLIAGWLGNTNNMGCGGSIRDDELSKDFH